MPQGDGGRPQEEATAASPPGESGTAAPEAAAQSEAPQGEAGAATAAASPLPAPADDQPRKRRRRRRRRGKRPPDAAPEGATPSPAPEAALPAVAPEPNAASGQQALPPGEPRPAGERRRKRRRRRRGTGGPPAAASAAGPQPVEAGGAVAAPDAAPRPQAPRQREERSERRGGDAPRDRDAGARRDGRQDKGPRGARPHGHDKDRDRFSRKPAQSLYSVESVVDRGFEEVPDAANSATTRRVDWTIVKRVVADRISARPISAVYMLRREGTDTEFAHLSAARAAVNKTIVHPEKLTRPKADHPTGKK